METIRTSDDVQKALTELATSEKVDARDAPEFKDAKRDFMAAVLVAMALGHGNTRAKELSHALIENPALLTPAVWDRVAGILDNKNPLIAVNGRDLLDSLANKLTDDRPLGSSFDCDKNAKMYKDFQSHAETLRDFLIADFGKHNNPRNFGILRNLSRYYPEFTGDIFALMKKVIADPAQDDYARSLAISTVEKLVDRQDEGAVDPAEAMEMIAPLVSNAPSTELREYAATYEHNIALTGGYRMKPGEAEKLRDMFKSQAEAAQWWEWRKRKNNNYVAHCLTIFGPDAAKGLPSGDAIRIKTGYQPPKCGSNGNVMPKG